MKKLLIVGAAVLLSSCSGAARQAKEPVKLPEEFEKNAVVTVGKLEYTADLHRKGADIWEWEFTEPDTIKGLKLTAAGDSCTMELEGLRVSADRSKLPEYGMMPLLDGVLEQLISGKNVSCVAQGKTLLETGTSAGLDYTAKFKGDEVVSVEIDQALRVKFK